MRAEAIRLEMVESIKELGAGEASADRENLKAARATGLAVTVVERLRWKKIKRVPADIADAVREALEAHNARQERNARRENQMLKRRIAALQSRLGDMGGDPDFYRPDADGLRGVVDHPGRMDRTGN